MRALHENLSLRERRQMQATSEALVTLLGLFVNKLADLNASLCGWQLSTPNTAHVFTRWVLPMLMDFGEINPLAQAGGSPENPLAHEWQPDCDVCLTRISLLA